MSKNELGICYESSTIFRIGEFVAKFWTVQIFWCQIPNRPTNCKNWLQTDDSRTEYVSATFPNICQFVAIRGIRVLCVIGV